MGTIGNTVKEGFKVFTPIASTLTVSAVVPYGDMDFSQRIAASLTGLPALVASTTH